MQESEGHGVQRLPAGPREWMYLVADGTVTEEQLRLAAERSVRKSGVGSMLVTLGFATEAGLAKSRAGYMGLPYEVPNPSTIPQELADSIPERTLRRHGVVPLRREGRSLVVATSDPSDIYAAEDLRTLTRLDIAFSVATKSDISAALDVLFAHPEPQPEPSKGEPSDQPDDAPVVRLFEEILEGAISDGASDIHLEAREDGLVVRIRVDGVLRDLRRVPEELRSGVVTRVKVLADLDIAERRVPQDGRFTAVTSRGGVDLRVASLPTVFGEGLVMRLLDPSRVELDFGRLGFAGREFEKYREVFRRNHGAVLVTGPTGSGKSTTLYATLTELNTPGKKIVTIEDPVEYRVAGLNQIQTNPRAGLTFASGLRSILRADPDVVMIGEVRDAETARTAVEASLTGHMVLATLHTNDAPSALTRLADMGVEPYLISSAIDCVVAQRLARRLCDSCKRSVSVSDSTLRQIGFPFRLSEERDFHEGVGCDDCSGSGYRGRVGIFEVMVVADEVRELVLGRASSGGIGNAAEEAGMVRLRQDGLRKAAAGLTSIEEVIRTVL